MQSAHTTNDAVKLRIARQLAPRRWQRGLDQLRIEIEKGRDWQAAINTVCARQAELGHLLTAALAAGAPAEITLELLQHRATRRTSWKALLTALVYPLFLLLAALLIGSLMSLAMLGLVDSSWQQNESQSYNAMLSRVHEFYDASVGGVLLILWVCVLIGIAFCLATPNAWLKLVGSVPVLGRPYRWMQLSELLSRISIFSQYQPALEKTLMLTEQSFGSQAPAAISRYLVQAIRQGEALPSALHKTIVSDARAGMALTLIEPSDLSHSTLQASRLVDEMILATCNQLRLILPVFIMLLVASLIWGTWSSYFEILSVFRDWFYF